MPIVLDQQQLNRDAERARVARWFGDSAIGPVFFASPGRAIPISADERDLWLRQAMRLVDHHVDQQRWVGFQAIALAVVLILAMGGTIAALGGLVPGLRTVPPPVAAVGGLSWPLVHAALYRRRLARWRRELCDRLFMRSSLDPAWVPYGKRYNLFAVAALALIAIGVGWTLLAAARGHQGDGLMPLLVLWPIAFALHLAGRRVDAVHRDRRLE